MFNHKSNLKKDKHEVSSHLRWIKKTFPSTNLNIFRFIQFSLRIPHYKKKEEEVEYQMKYDAVVKRFKLIFFFALSIQFKLK